MLKEDLDEKTEMNDLAKENSDVNTYKKRTAQEIGQASYMAPVEDCDKVAKIIRDRELSKEVVR